MNKPVLDEQQSRTLALLGAIYPAASMEEKKYVLGRIEGYAQARAEIMEAQKKTEENENRNPQ